MHLANRLVQEFSVLGAVYAGSTDCDWHRKMAMS